MFPYGILDNADIDDATITEVRLYLVSLGLCAMSAASWCFEACVLFAFVSLLLGIMGAETVVLFLLFRKLGYDNEYYYAWVGVVLNAFFAYPHVMLLKELRNGRMTAQLLKELRNGRMTAHKDIHENQSCHWVNDDAV